MDARSRIVGLLGLSVAACATSGPPPVENLPAFDEAEGVLFDDGMDLVTDPQGVGGRWQEEWEGELERRVARGDVVAIGTVHTLRTDVDLDRRTSYRLVFRADDVLKGTQPDGDLTLVSRQGARGYDSIDRAGERLLDQRYVAFVTRFRDAEGGAVTHWHLSPASEAVIRRVREHVASKSPTFHEVRVIETKH